VWETRPVFLLYTQAFITACSEHCGQWAQGQVLAGHNDFNVTIERWTAATAVDAWVANNTCRKLWIQQGTYPCNGCCTGGL
jgi:hypothetical protein